MQVFIATIVPFAGDFAPKGWAFCHGQTLPISRFTAVFSLLGTTYGGDGKTTFALPDLRGRAAEGADPENWDNGLGAWHDYPAAASGTNVHKSLALNYIICLEGIFPPRG